MKSLLVLIALVALLFASEYRVNQEESSIVFKASKFLVVGVEGQFSEFSGSVVLTQDGVQKIEGLVAISSLSTQNQKRDDHLKSDDYFNAAEFSNIEFYSDKIADGIVKAKVSIKGITKELDFKITKSELHAKSIVFTLTSIVDRQDFGLNGFMSSMIADDVEVIAKIVAYRK